MASDAQILANYTAVADNSPLSESKIQSLSLRLLSAIYAQLVLGVSGGSGGTTPPADIALGIDQSVDIDTIVTRLTQIRDNAQANRFDYELVLDATGALWIQRLDQVSGTLVYLDPTGTPGTPTAPLTIDRADTAPVVASFEAITTNAGNWVPNDILTRITLVGANGAPTNTTWLRANGTVSTANPVVGVDVREFERTELLILRTLETIASGGNALLTTIRDQTDTIESSLALIQTYLDGVESLLTPTLSGLQGGFNVTDIAATSPNLRYVSITNASATVLFLQLHDKGGALAPGDVPLSGYSTRIPGNSSYIDKFDVNVLRSPSLRVGVSSTFAIYTPATTAFSVTINTQA